MIDRVNGIRWKTTSTLEELKNFRHLVLVSRTKMHVQVKSDRLNTVGKKVGLRVNAKKKKTKVTRLNAKNQEPLSSGFQQVEQHLVVLSVELEYNNANFQIQCDYCFNSYSVSRSGA